MSGIDASKRPMVGVAVIVVKDGKVLLGKRLNSHGAGAWAFPGGHLEFGETVEDCAKREVFEETGLAVTNLKFESLTNDLFEKEEKHYITLFVRGEYVSGEAIVKEPDKCLKWEWFEWGKFPDQLFLSLSNLLETGYSPV